MRIAMVCPYAWDRVGGVQSHVRALSSALRARGHEVAILAPYLSEDAAQAGDNLLPVGRAFGIPANGSVAPLAFGPVAAADVRSALKEFDPAVVHLHEPLIPSISLFALLNSEAPAVGTFHAAAESSFGYQASRPWLRRTIKRLTMRTVVSEAARLLVERYFPGEYALTPNGVDVERFGRAEPIDLGPGRKILFLSRLEERKGLDVLIRAVAALRDTGATLVVAGDGPERRYCQSLARRLGVRTRWLGLVEESMKARLYRSCDVYCAPALGGESFGIVLLEAMAAGAPVVCSNLDGFRAVARGAALLVRPGDAGILATGLRSVLASPDKAMLMSEASRRVAARYDWAELAGGVESVYESAVRTVRVGA
jgi:phosphatidyl-myo-inositol alpha-mannosyltransferase